MVYPILPDNLKKLLVNVLLSIVNPEGLDSSRCLVLDERQELLRKFGDTSCSDKE